MQRRLPIRLGLLSLGLPILLTSCANQPAIRTQTVSVNVPVYVALPATLTAPVVFPGFPTTVTNASLADYILSLQASLKQANGQLSKIQSLQPSH